jgi:hypothetical protein
VIAHKPLEYLENEPNYYLESPTIFSLTVLEIGTSLGLATAALSGSQSVG